MNIIKQLDQLLSLDKDKKIRIYLNNNICILSNLSNIQLFEDHLTYDGKSGTIYFPDQTKIYPKNYEYFENKIGNMNIIPYSAICIITNET